MENNSNLSQRQFKNTTKFYKCQAIFINLVKESFSLVKGLVKEKSPCDFNAPRIAQNSVQEQFRPTRQQGLEQAVPQTPFRPYTFCLDECPYSIKVANSTYPLHLGSAQSAPLVGLPNSVANSIAHRQRFCQVKSQKTRQKFSAVYDLVYNSVYAPLLFWFTTLLSHTPTHNTLCNPMSIIFNKLPTFCL